MFVTPRHCMPPRVRAGEKSLSDLRVELHHAFSKLEIQFCEPAALDDRAERQRRVRHDARAHTRLDILRRSIAQQQLSVSPPSSYANWTAAVSPVRRSFKTWRVRACALRRPGDRATRNATRRASADGQTRGGCPTEHWKPAPTSPDVQPSPRQSGCRHHSGSQLIATQQ